jgi:TetR/AcrR family transcriptional repressor of nem operon
LIATVLSRYASEVHRDRPQEGCPIVGIASELQRHSSVAGSEIQKYLEEWVKLLAPHLQKNISEEKKRMEILGLLSQAVGALLLARLTKNSKLSSEILESCRVSII